MWRLSHRADPLACTLADRHYSRQKVGSPQFMPPGSCVVFTAETESGRAVWGTSAPFAEYVRHAWAGAWMCSIFRNEGAGRASDLIRQAVAATRAFYGEPPAHGMLTFIDRKKIAPTMTRGVKTWGRTYRLAGFRQVEDTKGGLAAFQLLPADMPPPEPPIGLHVTDLFAGAAA